jgi:hypothetical protein
MTTNISLLESQVNKKMKTLRSKSKFLEAGKVAPIHLDYPYSNVGLMLFVGKMGSGKTNDVLKHLIMTDSLDPMDLRFIPRLSIQDLLVKARRPIIHLRKY